MGHSGQWWQSRVDGTPVDGDDDLTRNELIDSWLELPGVAAGVNRSVLKKQVRACVAELGGKAWVQELIGIGVARAASARVNQPLDGSQVTRRLARFIETHAGPIARQATLVGRMSFEELCPAGLTSTVRSQFESTLRDALASAARRHLLGGDEVHVNAMLVTELEAVHARIGPQLRASIADRIRTFAETLTSGRDSDLLTVTALSANPDATPKRDRWKVVSASERDRLWQLALAAQRDLGPQGMWSRWRVDDAENLLQDAALRTMGRAMGLAAQGVTVQTVAGLFMRSLRNVQSELSIERGDSDEILVDLPPEPSTRGLIGEGDPFLRSSSLRAALVGIATKLDQQGTWEAQCAAVILRFPAADDVQVAVRDLEAWLAQRVCGWPPSTRWLVLSGSLAEAATMVFHLLSESLRAESELWAILASAPGEPL